MLSGLTGTFLGWAAAKGPSEGGGAGAGQEGCEERGDARRRLLACLGGSLVTRVAAQAAYSRQGRCMLTSDVLSSLPSVVTALFPAPAAL